MTENDVSDSTDHRYLNHLGDRIRNPRVSASVGVRLA